MTDSPDLVVVRLLSVPVPLRELSTQHGEELMREMTLIAQQVSDGDVGALPRRLIQVGAEVRETFGIFTSRANEEMDEAAERGVDVIDEIVYRVPASVGPFCRHLLDIIAETDEYCRAGEHLLTLATPPDVLAYQRWIIGEFIRQVDGLPPIPWPEFRGLAAV